MIFLYLPQHIAFYVVGSYSENRYEQKKKSTSAYIRFETKQSLSASKLFIIHTFFLNPGLTFYSPTYNLDNLNYMGDKYWSNFVSMY